MVLGQMISLVILRENQPRNEATFYSPSLKNGFFDFCHFSPLLQGSGVFHFTLIIVVLYLITIHYQNRKILILQATPFTFLFSMYTSSNDKWTLKFQ